MIDISYIYSYNDRCMIYNNKDKYFLKSYNIDTYL